MLRETRVLMPQERYIYVADDAAFPYGDWEDNRLRDRMVELFGEFLDRWNPDICVIACNTASTIGIAALREAYPEAVFVGTVPAIKPAAERTRSGLISVLATPGTVKRQYTRDLIDEYAGRCEVNLVGSTRLAALAETYLRGGFTDEAEVAREITDCFIREGDRYTDIVVLACTHYPFLVNRMRKMAPWPVDWIDTSEAIARRAFSLWREMGGKSLNEAATNSDDLHFTGGVPDKPTAQLLLGFGLAAR